MVPPLGSPAVEAYLASLTERLGDALPLAGAYAIGSVANGAFDAERSDVDVMAVCTAAPSQPDLAAVIESCSQGHRADPLRVLADRGAELAQARVRRLAAPRHLFDDQPGVTADLEALEAEPARVLQARNQRPVLRDVRACDADRLPVRGELRAVASGQDVSGRSPSRARGARRRCSHALRVSGVAAAGERPR